MASTEADTKSRVVEIWFKERGTCDGLISHVQTVRDTDCIYDEIKDALSELDYNEVDQVQILIMK